LHSLLQGCAKYKPIIDTAGRSGTFNEDKAKEITNDIQHCNTTFASNISFWLMSPKAETKYWLN
jgi:hypothetical protein